MANQGIDITQLDRETRDRLDLKSMTDPTFYRALEEDYTENLFEIINSRKDVDANHSFISSIEGSQGCHCKGTKIFIRRNGKMLFLPIEQIVVGDEVVSLSSSGIKEWKKVLNRFEYKNQKYLNIKMKYGNEVNVTLRHKLFTLISGKVAPMYAGNLKNGDMILSWQGNIEKYTKKDVDYYRGVIHGSYIADGSGDGNISKEDNEVVEYLLYCAKKANMVATRRKRGIGIAKCENLSQLGKKSIKKIVSNGSMSYMKGVLDGYIICDSGFNMRKGASSGKINLEVKFVSKCNEWIEQLQFLLLYFYGVSSNKQYRILKSGKWLGNKYYSLNLASESASKLLSSFDFFGKKRIRVGEILEKHYQQPQGRSCYKKLPIKGGKFDLNGLGKLGRHRLGSIRRCIREGYIQDIVLSRWIKEMPELRKCGFADYERLFYSYFGEEVSEICQGISDVYDIEVEDNHNYVLTNGVLSSNSGKSFCAIALCFMLDPNFSTDHIFFDYNDLVYNKGNLKPGTAVLVDEQSESYGVDSHRVNIILEALKEQLRKKSIHFIFCSPTLKPEYQSSLYVMETMFLDYETNECYAAFKTRDLHTLGYVRIPHPYGVGVSKEFLAAYEAKKDAHLDRLTGRTQQDEIEVWCNKVLDTDLFKTAEKIYLKKCGYIPSSMLHQIINKLYTELRSSIIVGEIAARIKLNKELSGVWTIPGTGGGKKKKS